MYLHIDGSGSERTFETLRSSHFLKCIRIGQVTLYHRSQLVELVMRLAGIGRPAVTGSRRRGTAVERVLRSAGR